MASVFHCCFRPPPEKLSERPRRHRQAASSKAGFDLETSQSSLDGQGQGGSSGSGDASSLQLPQPHLSKSFRSLNIRETNAVQGTLLQVSSLIQKFAEERGDNPSPINALKKGLSLIATDSRAAYASVHAMTAQNEFGMGLASLGLPDALGELLRLQRMAGSGTALEELLKQHTEYLSWQPSKGQTMFSDWRLLHKHAELDFLAAVPIKLNDRIMGVLTMGFKDNDEDRSENSMWPTYCQLVAATISSVLKDPSVERYLEMMRELADAPCINTLMKQLIQHLRTTLGQASDQHLWFRVALSTSNQQVATLFDDLQQAPALVKPPLSRTATPERLLRSARSIRLRESLDSSYQSEASSATERQGMLRTVVAMKSTILRIVVQQHQQVMVPDVQRLVNQSGNASTDIFNTSLLKPPSSVMVIPLRIKNSIYGAIFAMSDVASNFTDVAWRLREVCHIVGPHLLNILTSTLAAEYAEIQNMRPDTPQSISSSITLSNSQEETLSPTAEDDSPALLQRSASVSAQSFSIRRSATGALVTGLTEKLNQKRIRSSMDPHRVDMLQDLEIMHLLGEGGFAKVFRGSWRGLAVGVKVVSDEGRNERMAMKNAHEIALLGAMSHPNIVQAYDCMTDVRAMDVCNICMKRAQEKDVIPLPILKDLTNLETRTCHIEIIEYCDLGNLANAIKCGRFHGQATATHQPVALHALVLTLIEVASAMGYLHRMGVVHCDLKPANVLLKTCNNDQRGFTAKVSDFGLSRVEDDELSASFPFNSCGTVAYVAPEAMAVNKRVDHTVDVYAFGILMWEVFTTQQPYGKMKQQQLVQEVALRGLRPKFPAWAPESYAELAQMCWATKPADRPGFDEVVDILAEMLRSPELLGSNETTTNYTLQLMTTSLN